MPIIALRNAPTGQRSAVAGGPSVPGRAVPAAARIPLFIFIVLVIAYTAIAPNFDQPLIDSVVDYAFAGAAVFLFVSPSGSAEWAVAALAAMAFSLCHALSLRNTIAEPRLSLYAGMLGRGALVAFAWRAVWADAIASRRWRRIWPIPVAILIFVFAATLALNLTVVARRPVLDAYLYLFDGSLGFQPSFFFGRLFWRYHLVAELGRAIYSSLPVAIALVCAAYVKDRSPWRLLGILASAGVFGYVLYFVFPATGPRYAAGSAFPLAPRPFSTLAQMNLHPLDLPIPAPRNAIPSLHMAWALLLWFACRPLSRLVRGFSLLYVAMTVVVTLGTGEHYLVDLVVALPFAVAVQSLWVQGTGRYRLAAAGAALTMIWLAAARYETSWFLVSPIIPWTCVLASSALSLILARKSGR